MQAPYERFEQIYETLAANDNEITMPAQGIMGETRILASIDADPTDRRNVPTLGHYATILDTIGQPSRLLQYGLCAKPGGVIIAYHSGGRYITPRDGSSVRLTRLPVHVVPECRQDTAVSFYLGAMEHVLASRLAVS